MSNKMLGVDVNRVTTSAIHELGLQVVDEAGGNVGAPLSFSDGLGGTITKTNFPGNEYKYVQAGAAIAAGDAVVLSNAAADATKPGIVIPTAAATDIVEGIAHVAIASGSYGFITVKGRVYTAKVTDAGASEGDALGASGTAGTLISITGTTPTGAEVIAAIRYAAGRRAMALVDVGTNLWDVYLRG